MKTILIPSLIAACVSLSATAATAYPTGQAGRAIAHDTGIVHQVQGGHHRNKARGCRLSHGKLICGGGHGRDRDHGRSNRGHGKKHGGDRH